MLISTPSLEVFPTSKGSQSPTGLENLFAVEDTETVGETSLG